MTADGSGRAKPNIVAPGADVRSAWLDDTYAPSSPCLMLMWALSLRERSPDGRYVSISGTSMATPAVAGAVLLLWEHFPSLRRRVHQTEARRAPPLPPRPFAHASAPPERRGGGQELLYSSATPLYDTAQGCGGDTSTTLPNEVFGHGQVDLAAAFERHEAAPRRANRLLYQHLRE